MKSGGRWSFCHDAVRHEFGRARVITIDVELQDAVPIAEVVNYATLLGSSRQGGEEIGDTLVVATCGEEVEVELRVSGDNDGAIAFTALGEDVYEETLHSVWSCRADVDSVASTRIEFVGLARCSTLEDGSLATERQEVLERQ